MNNWSTILNNAKTAADIVAILRNVLAQLDSKSFTQIEELFKQTDLTFQQKLTAFQAVIANVEVEKNQKIASLLEAIDTALNQGLVGAGSTDQMLATLFSVTQRELNTKTQNTVHQNSSYVERLKALTAISSNYLIRKSSSELAVGCRQSATHGSEFAFRIDLDGMLLMRGGFANVLEQTGVQYNAELVGGTSGWVLSDTNPSGNYTTTVNKQFNINFTGTNLTFSAYTDNRGGKWSASIDGAAPVIVSVYAATAGIKDFVIANNLANTAHQAVFTFIGADTSTTGTARGWLLRDTLTGDSGSSTARVINYSAPAVVKTTGVRPQMLAINSIPEFAINCRPASQPAMAGKWVPCHGTESGACRNIIRNIVVDGVNIGSDINAISTVPTAINSLIITQQYTAYCASDVAGNYPLWLGYIVHKYENGEVTVTHKINYTTDVFCGAGYYVMLPTSATYNDKLVLSDNKEQLIAAVARSTPFSQASNTALFKSNAYNCAIAIRANAGEAMGLIDKAYKDGQMFLEERTDAVSKLYYKRFDNETITAGTTHRYQNRFFIIADCKLISCI